MGEAIFTRYSKAKIPTVVANSNYATNAGYATNANHAVYSNIAINANRANYANQLATSRTIGVNLNSSVNVTFNGTASIYPGVYGILPVNKGGTGVNSLANLKNSLGIGGESISGIGGVWKEIKNFNVPGNYEFNVPDLFGGKNYTIGVVLIGGGQSGGIILSRGSNIYDYVSGGHGGNLVYFTKEVKPGIVHNIVVGAGGVTKITGFANTSFGQPGYNSSFDDIITSNVAAGNKSHVFCTDFSKNLIFTEAGWNPFEYKNMIFTGGGRSGYLTQVPSYGINVFTGICGGTLKAAYMPANGNRVSITSTNGNDANYPGCGGGALVVSYSEMTGGSYGFAPGAVLRSGNGGNGCVIIYAATGL